MPRLGLVLVASLAAAILWGSAQAAGSPAPTPAPVTPPTSQLPANTPTPGQVQSTLPVTPSLPQSKAGPETTTASPSTTTVPEGGPTVTVVHFQITGNTLYGDAVLQPLLASWLNRPVTLADLYRAADAITKYYQSHGYGLARATIPQQEFAGGTAQFEVVEGRIGKVSVEGDSRTRRAVIEKRISDLKGGQVYTDAAMDRAVLLANDLPGLQAQATLEPGADFGTADLVYKVQDVTQTSGQVSIDDYGRKDVGMWRLNAEVDIASLTGSGDKLSAQITHTEANLLNFGGLTYSFPLGAPGGLFTADYNQSEYRVAGETFKELGVSGRTDNGTLSYQYPEIRGRLEDFYLGLGVEHSGSATLAGGQIITNANLNLLQLTSVFTKIYDSGAYYSLDGTFATNGRKNYGTTRDAERARFELDASGLLPFATVWGFQYKGAGEWSPDPLADTEKYSLGGPDNVRGFVTAEQRGDSALFVSGELQRSFGADKTFSAGWFLDSGRAWLKKYDTYEEDTKTHKEVAVPTPGAAETLTATGLELNWQSVSHRWYGRFQWAWAIGGYKPSDGNAGGHIWITLGMNFGGTIGDTSSTTSTPQS